MRKEEIFVMNRDYERVPVKAEKISEHLWIHASLTYPDWFVITHMPSGCRVRGDHANLRLVRKVAKALAHLPWHTVKTYRSVKACRKLGPEVDRICKEHGL